MFLRSLGVASITLLVSVFVMLGALLIAYVLLTLLGYDVAWTTESKLPSSGVFIAAITLVAAFYAMATWWANRSWRRATRIMKRVESELPKDGTAPKTLIFVSENAKSVMTIQLLPNQAEKWIDGSFFDINGRRIIKNTDLDFLNLKFTDFTLVFRASRPTRTINGISEWMHRVLSDSSLPLITPLVTGVCVFISAFCSELLRQRIVSGLQHYNLPSRSMSEDVKTPATWPAGTEFRGIATMMINNGKRIPYFCRMQSDTSPESAMTALWILSAPFNNFPTKIANKPPSCAHENRIDQRFEY